MDTRLQEGIDLHVGGGKPGLLVTSETVRVDLAPLTGDRRGKQSCDDEGGEVLEIVLQAALEKCAQRVRKKDVRRSRAVGHLVSALVLCLGLECSLVHSGRRQARG